MNHGGLEGPKKRGVQKCKCAKRKSAKVQKCKCAKRNIATHILRGGDCKRNYVKVRAHPSPFSAICVATRPRNQEGMWAAHVVRTVLCSATLRNCATVQLCNSVQLCATVQLCNSVQLCATPPALPHRAQRQPLEKRRTKRVGPKLLRDETTRAELSRAGHSRATEKMVQQSTVKRRVKRKDRRGVGYAWPDFSTPLHSTPPVRSAQLGDS